MLHNFVPTNFKNTIASFHTIPSSATLNITMNINAHVPNKHTRYRPVERSDGVVVLQRPYRPAATLPISQSNKFEKHVPTYTVASSAPEPRTSAAQKRTEDDLVGVGAQIEVQRRGGYNGFVDAGRGGDDELVAAGRDGYNDLELAGRGGYNEILSDWKPHEEAMDMSAILSEFSKVARRPGLSQMQRFLNEGGPWSTYDLRES